MSQVLCWIPWALPALLTVLVAVSALIGATTDRGQPTHLDPVKPSRPGSGGEDGTGGTQAQNEPEYLPRCDASMSATPSGSSAGSMQCRTPRWSGCLHCAAARPCPGCRRR